MRSHSEECAHNECEPLLCAESGATHVRLLGQLLVYPGCTLVQTGTDRETQEGSRHSEVQRRCRAAALMCLLVCVGARAGERVQFQGGGELDQQQPHGGDL